MYLLSSAACVRRYWEAVGGDSGGGAAISRGETFDLQILIRERTKSRADIRRAERDQRGCSGGDRKKKKKAAGRAIICPLIGVMPYRFPRSLPPSGIAADNLFLFFLPFFKK